MSVGSPITEKQLRTLLQIKGNPVDGARDVFKKSYQLGILDEEKLWLDVIEDRNATVHTYDENKAREMVARIRARYAPAFVALLSKCKSE